MSSVVLGESKENVKRPRVQASSEPALYVKRLSENAVLPSRATPHAAGYDLYRYLLAVEFLDILTFSLPPVLWTRVFLPRTRHWSSLI